MKSKGIKKSKEKVSEVRNVERIEEEESESHLNDEYIAEARIFFQGFAGGKFNAEVCANCPGGRVKDRVCVNSHNCGNKYLQLICGKCHFEEHFGSKQKSEIEVDEFLFRISKFIKTQSSQSQSLNAIFPKIDDDFLQKSVSEIDVMRLKLAELKASVKMTIDSYERGSEQLARLRTLHQLTLSKMTVDQVNSCLNMFRDHLDFDKGKFKRHSIEFDRAKELQRGMKRLEDGANEVERSIVGGLIEGNRVDLTHEKCFNFVTQEINSSSGGFQPISLIADSKSGEILVELCPPNFQFALGKELSVEKKYRLRLRIDQTSENFGIGLIPAEFVGKHEVYQIENHEFYKRKTTFGIQKGCSRVVRGTDIFMHLAMGMEIEVRVDFPNNILEFITYSSDHPKWTQVISVNTMAQTQHQFKKHLQKYVFFFSGYMCSIAIVSLEEIYHLNHW